MLLEVLISGQRIEGFFCPFLRLFVTSLFMYSEKTVSVIKSERKSLQVVYANNFINFPFGVLGYSSIFRLANTGALLECKTGSWNLPFPFSRFRYLYSRSFKLAMGELEVHLVWRNPSSSD